MKRLIAIIVTLTVVLMLSGCQVDYKDIGLRECTVDDVTYVFKDYDKVYLSYGENSREKELVQFVVYENYDTNAQNRIEVDLFEATYYECIYARGQVPRE